MSRFRMTILYPRLGRAHGASALCWWLKAALQARVPHLLYSATRFHFKERERGSWFVHSLTYNHHRLSSASGSGTIDLRSSCTSNCLHRLLDVKRCRGSVLPPDAFRSQKTNPRLLDLLPRGCQKLTIDALDSLKPLSGWSKRQPHKALPRLWCPKQHHSL